jgi:hypothetical protein
MRTAEEIAKAWAERKSLLWLRENADRKGDGFTIPMLTTGGASGIWNTVSDDLIREVTKEAFKQVVERAIQNVEKRFSEANIPLN